MSVESSAQAQRCRTKQQKPPQLHPITSNYPKQHYPLSIDVLYYIISKLKKRPRSNPFTRLKKDKHQLTKKPRAK